MAESKTGVFWDIEKERVVDSQPERGVQIVAPGAEVTPDRQAEIDRYKQIERGEAPEPQTVTSERKKA